MTSHDFDYAILERTSHRPWEMPDRPWVMTQTWRDLLFAHWPVAATELQNLVPQAFDLDRLDGTCWLGIVPFRMTNVAPRAVPSLPWVSQFPELNVRTYVRVRNKPGIYFFSLDAGSRLAVRVARALLNLPYYSASMDVSAQGGVVTFESMRLGGAQEAWLSATFQPVGRTQPAARGSLEHFLTERYCLYNLGRRGKPYRLEIHHPPWALQAAAAEFKGNTMADAIGVRLPTTAPLLHFSARQDMVAWAPSPL